MKKIHVENTLVDTCPKCGKECELDLDEGSVNYIYKKDSNHAVTFVCNGCGNDWARFVRVNMQAELI